MMRPSPIGPFWWAQRLESAPICVPSRKTAMRSPSGGVTMRAPLSGMDSGGPTASHPSLPRALARSPARSRQPAARWSSVTMDQADTDPFNFDNIAKQRNPSEKGKELAKTFGDAIRQVGIPVGEVYTSNFNRAFETAVLAGFKDIEKTTDLTEGGLIVSPDENSRRAAALRRMLAQVPEKGKNTFLITHKPNIIDALGKNWFDVKEGEASI